VLGRRGRAAAPAPSAGVAVGYSYMVVPFRDL